MSRKKIKPGEIVTIRVNPKDCMSCVDVVQKIGLEIRGASFSTVVSSALSSMLETFRQNGIVPTRDGFEFSQIMASFPKTVRSTRARALAITETFSRAGSDVRVPPLVTNVELERKKRRFQELAQKSNADEANMDQAEKDELTALAQELNPL